MAALSSIARSVPECIYGLKTLSNHQYHIETGVIIQQGHKKIRARALIDSGASGCCVHPQFVKKYNLQTQKLAKPRKVYNVDGTPCGRGNIDKIVDIWVDTGSHKTKHSAAVTDIGNDNIILGLDWLQRNNPIINWDKRMMTNRSTRQQVPLQLRRTSTQNNRYQVLAAIEGEKAKHYRKPLTRKKLLQQGRDMLQKNWKQQARKPKDPPFWPKKKRNREEEEEEPIKKRRTPPSYSQGKPKWTNPTSLPPKTTLTEGETSQKRQEKSGKGTMYMPRRESETQEAEARMERQEVHQPRGTPWQRAEFQQQQSVEIPEEDMPNYQEKEVKHVMREARAKEEQRQQHSNEWIIPGRKEGRTLATGRRYGQKPEVATGSKRKGSEIVAPRMAKRPSKEPPEDDTNNQQQKDDIDTQMDTEDQNREAINVVKMPRGLSIKRIIGRDKWSTMAQKLSQAKAQREGRIMDGTKRDPRTLVPKELWEYLDIFDEEKAKRLPKHTQWDMEINFEEGANQPRLRRIYKLDREEEKSIKEFVNENMDKGFIRRPIKGSNAYTVAAPVFFIGKKDGGRRMVMDYRELNKVTKRDVYPLPNIDKLMEKTRGAKFFTALDLRNGYNNIRIKPGHEWKAAFRTPDGVYEPTVMFFGLKNSPAQFQRFMDDIFSEMSEKDKDIYLDDILIIGGETREEHMNLVKQSLKILRKRDLYCKAEKCFFCQEEVDYLGVKVGRNGVKMDEDKVKGILDWPDCKNVKQIRQFLGFCGFYRQYIDNYAAITKPLTQLLKRNLPFQWGQPQRQAMDTLKEAFRTGPILRHPDPSLQYILETDASNDAIGAQLAQTDNKGEKRPVAFLSHKLTDTEKNYPIHDKELLAVIFALKKWRHLIRSSTQPVHIYTDHHALEFFGKKQDCNQRQARWTQLLEEFNYKIEYRPGKAATVPDALSRRPDLKSTTKINQGVRVINPDRIVTNTATIARKDTRTEEIKETYKHPHWAKDLQNYKEQLGKDNITKVEEGLWVFHNPRTNTNRILIPRDKDLQQQIFKEHHDDTIAGHPGMDKTSELIRRHYHWKRMEEDIREYVSSCRQCQQNKPIRANRTAPLQPLDIPKRPWLDISYDLIGPLPVSKGCNSILTVVDRYSKYTELIALKDTATAEDVARVMHQRIFRQRGYPDSIVSDRGTQFNNKFTKELAKALGINLKYGTAYHKETDGQTERVNQEVEIYLRNYVNYNQDNWAALLSDAQIALNNRVHKSTGQSPYFLVNGYHPRFTQTPHQPNSTQAESWIEMRIKAQQKATASLQRAQELMKRTADERRGGLPKIAIGDMVWLDTKNLKLAQPSAKLGPVRIGPFKVTRQLGPVTYQLALPRTYLQKVHNVFYAGLLQPANTNLSLRKPLPPPPPPDIIEGEEHYEIEEIRGARRQGRGIQYLIKWQGYEDMTWEPARNLVNAEEALQNFYKIHPEAPHVQVTSIASNSRFVAGW